MQIDPLSANDFGARISGIVLSQLDQQDFKAIYGAFLKYGFIVFPDQALTEAEQITFGERFGALEFGALPLANQIKLEDAAIAKFSRLPVSECKPTWATKRGIPTRPIGLSAASARY